MYKWLVGIFIVFISMNITFVSAANERQFSQASGHKQPDNPRSFGQQSVSEKNSFTRTFGSVETKGTKAKAAFGFAFSESTTPIAHIAPMDTPSPSTPQPSQLNRSEPEINFTEDFLSDPARVGGLVGGITFGAVLIHPLAPVLGNVLGYLVGKKSDYSERQHTLIQEHATVRPIVTATDTVEIIRLSDN